MDTDGDNWYKQGVWYNETKNSLALVYQNEKGVIVVDKNKYKRHPIFRLSVHVVENLTGEYFFKKSLKGYVHIDEVDFRGNENETK